jgi:hypothetical protein
VITTWHIILKIELLVRVNALFDRHRHSIIAILVQSLIQFANALHLTISSTAQSKTGIFYGCGVAEAPSFFCFFFKPASLAVLFLSFFVRFSCSSGIFECASVLMRVQCRIGALPRCLVGSLLKPQIL